MDALIAQWAQQVRAAATERRMLRIQGAGTKAHLTHALAGEVLDVRPHQGVVSYEPEELVITARSGTPLAEVEAVLAQKGQRLPFDAPHAAQGATLGGAIAAGWAGPDRMALGPIRDAVLGAWLLNGRGQHLRFGGQVMKNVAGYDISRLLAGAWGTLGVVTEWSLKVLPIPTAQRTCSWPLTQAEALAQLRQWAALPVPLQASVWLPEVRSLSAHAPDATPGRLWVRWAGAAAAVQAAQTRFGGEDMDPDAARSWWASLRDQTHACFQSTEALWRLSLPPTTGILKWGDMASSSMPQLAAVEWHGAQRWVWAPVAAATALRAEVARLGGHATLWRWPANGEVHDKRASAVPVFHPQDPVQAALQHRIQQAFDPDGVFNPHFLTA